MALLALKFKQSTLRPLLWLALTLFLGVTLPGFEVRDWASMDANGGAASRSRFLSVF